MRQHLSSVRRTIKEQSRDCASLFDFFQRFVLNVLAFVLVSAPGHAFDADAADPFPDLKGYRYGVSVTDLKGNILIAYRANERFTPASNVKLFTTAAALRSADALAALKPSLQVVSQPAASGPPNLALVGRGDPTVGFGEDCTIRCIETLAAAVARSGITEIGDIVGDDQWFADERRPLGWSWDDLKFGHGTAISAIAVNDNILPLRVFPSNEPGTSVRAAWIDNGPRYFDIKNEAKTGDASGSRALRLERRLGERTARLYGELPAGSRSMTLDLAVDDPAHLAAWYFKRALKNEGVSVSGELRTRRRPLQYADEPILADLNDPAAPQKCAYTPQDTSEGTVIASLKAAPISEIVTKINQESINLYAEILLRQLGRAAGTGSSFCGLLQIQEFLTDIGVSRASYDIADGSGLSNYNRVTPATLTALLRHAAAAPWGDVYRESLPVGAAANGTLKYRFRDTPLEGKIYAKTGTLNHVDALSGYMQARSGRTLVFSIIVNDRPLESPSAMPLIDAALLKIADQH